MVIVCSYISLTEDESDTQIINVLQSAGITWHWQIGMISTLEAFPLFRKHVFAKVFQGTLNELSNCCKPELYRTAEQLETFLDILEKWLKPFWGPLYGDRVGKAL